MIIANPISLFQVLLPFPKLCLYVLSPKWPSLPTSQTIRAQGTFWKRRQEERKTWRTWGGLWAAVLCMWHGCWTQELPAPVVACTRPACSLSLPECRGRGKSPKPCDEGKILQTREVVDKLFLLYIKYSIKSNSQQCKKNYTRQLNGYSCQKTIPPIHPTSEVAKKSTRSHQLAKKKASEKNSRLILD